MARTLVMLGLLIALAYLAFCALLFVTQRSLIYMPQLAGNGSGRPHFVLPVKGADLRVTHRAHGGRNAVVYFGGNAENVALNLEAFASAFPNHALYLLHYRGYGGSSGRPSQEALYDDGLALTDHVQARHPNVVIIGRSLGSGVATYVASQRTVERVVLVTPYDSIAAVAYRRFPFVPIRWLMLDPYESWRYAPKIRAPTRLIVAGDDEIIPPAHAQVLHQRFRDGIATLHVIGGVGHNHIALHPDYLPLLSGAR